MNDETPLKYCCGKMQHARDHAIIRTNPVRFGPDVLDPPLNEIRFCPWCGSLWALPDIITVKNQYHIDELARADKAKAETLGWPHIAENNPTKQIQIGSNGWKADFALVQAIADEVNCKEDNNISLEEVDDVIQELADRDFLRFLKTTKESI